MNNTPRIEGTPDPRQLGKLGQKDDINTEHFKKILRVERSEEAEQKNKRNLSKSEEEDDDVEKSEETNTPQTLFSDLMKGQQKTNSLFDVEGGKAQVFSADTNTKAAKDTPSHTSTSSPLPPYNMIAQGSTTTDPGKSIPSESISIDTSSTIKEGANITLNESAKDSRKDSSEDRGSRKKEKKVPTSDFTASEKTQIQKKEEAPSQFSLSKEDSDAPIAAPVPKKSKDTIKKPIPTKQKEKVLPPPPISDFTPAKNEKIDAIETPKKDIASLPEKKTSPPKEVEEAVTASVEIPKMVQSEITTDAYELATSLQKEKGPILEDSNERNNESESQAKKQNEGTIENIQINPDTPPPMMPVGIPPIEAPAYTSLSKDAFDFFEQMIGLITMERSNNGVSTTTIKLSMPGSIFHGCEIKLDHYDTAPHSFNVQLLGTPEAVQSFSSNLTKLIASFEEEKHSFSINIQSPILLKEEKPLFQRKEGVGNQMGDPSQKQN